MTLYFCTPRGDVHSAPPIGCSFRYTEKARDPETNRVVSEHHHIKAWGALPVRYAPNIEIARVDFYADQVLKDLLEDIRRMFRYAEYDRWALARREKRRWRPVPYRNEYSVIRESQRADNERGCADNDYGCEYC